MPEPLEDRAVVRVAVVADHVRPVQDVADLEERGDVLEVVGDLVDAVDERERAHPAELARHRLEQGQRERGELGDRARHVAQQVQVGPRDLGPLERRVEQDAARRQRPADRPAHVEPAPVAAPAAAGHLRRERPGQRPDRLAHRGHLAGRRAEEVDLLGAEQLQRPGRLVGAPQLGELAADLLGEQPLERLDPLGKLRPEATLVDAAGPPSARSAREHLGHQPRELERAQDAVEEVALRRVRLAVHAADSARPPSRPAPQRLGIAAADGVHDQLEQLDAPLARAAVDGRRRSRLVVICAARRRARPAVAARASGPAPDREVELEQELEGRPVLGPLDERRRQRAADLARDRGGRSALSAPVASITSDDETGTPASRSWRDEPEERRAAGRRRSPAA